MSLYKLYFFWPKEIVKKDLIDRHLGPVVKASYRDQRYLVHPRMLSAIRNTSASVHPRRQGALSAFVLDMALAGAREHARSCDLVPLCSGDASGDVGGTQLLAYACRADIDFAFRCLESTNTCMTISYVPTL
jgi:hypothetical protein